MDFPKVLFSLVSDSNFQRLERALPHGYTFEQFSSVEGKQDVFNIFSGFTLVAIVVAGENGFEFLFEDNRQGRQLRLELETIYFPNNIKWLVVFPWHNAWSYSGEPKASAELAMADIEDIAFKSDHQPQLVAFHASAWPTQMLKVQHSWTIHGNTKVSCRKGDADAGDMLYQLTTEE